MKGDIQVDPSIPVGPPSVGNSEEDIDSIIETISLAGQAEVLVLCYIQRSVIPVMRMSPEKSVRISKDSISTEWLSNSVIKSLEHVLTILTWQLHIRIFKIIAVFEIVL